MLRFGFAGAVVVAAGLTSVALGQMDFSGYQTVELSEGEIAAIQEAVRNNLRDPESARFEQLGAAQSGGAKVVCGLVNAKNSFGGYTGRQPFMLFGDGTLWEVMTIGGPDNEQEATISMCVDFKIWSEN